jgi:MazG family protein
MGDVLFLICFAVTVKREAAPDFTLEAIATHAHDKIKSRHPHVFGDARADTPEESIAHWERAKAAERARRNIDTLDGVAGNLPPLRHALKIQERAASVGFDWDRVDGVIAKLREEVSELEAALRSGDGDAIDHEMGDVLFSAVNVSRFLKIDPDEALQKSISKFIRRFQSMESAIGADGKRLESMTLDEMETYWTRAKSE